MNPYCSRALSFALACAVLAAWPAAGAEEPKVLPDPDGKPADMRRPVQVFILMGQSNMLGAGKPSKLQGIAAEKYPYLVDDAGEWTVRKDVRNVFVMCSGNSPAKDYKNEWMTISGNIGPEMGIGHYVGHATDAPVLILKSCIGNRSLGWDLLPPGSEPYEHGGKVQPGYRGTPDDPGGDTGGDMSKGWYAGCQYDGDVAAAQAVLANLDKYYPGAKKYEVAGFFWWQGDKDMRNAAHFERYEKNLIQLIKALRKDFKAPNARFVTASLGQTKRGSRGGDGKILDAMEAVSKSSDPELKGKVGFVYSHPLSKGGSSSGHYGGNPETYMNVGEAMGKAMVKLLGSAGTRRSHGDPRGAAALAAIEKLVEERQYVEAVAALRQLRTTRRGSQTGKEAAERLEALLADPAICQVIVDAEADAFQARCVAAETKKDYALAIKLYERYVAQFPKATRFAEVQARLEALKSDTTIQTNIKSAQAEAECKRWMAMADNYAKNGMDDRARQYLKKIVAKYGDTAWGSRARSRLAVLGGR